MNDYRILANRHLTGPITREELDTGEVRFSNVALLDRGIWTDSGSGQPTEYDPHELEVVEGATVNIAHDAENEVSEVGYIEADSWEVENGTGYANIVLDMDSAASEYADENLQAALESEGEVGFGGPSIEIPANAYDLEENASGYPKLINGEIHGLGLVMDPASKSVSFGHQTAQRGVALSGGQTPLSIYRLNNDMDENITAEKLLERLGLDLEEVDFELQDGVAIQDLIGLIADEMNVPAADVMEAISDLDGADDGEDMEEDEEEEEDRENEEEDYDEEEEEEEEEEDRENEVSPEELASEIATLRSEVEQLRDEHESLMEAEEVEAELSEALESLREEVADSEVVEDLDKRLSEVESEPKAPKSMADNGDSTAEWKDWASADGTPEYDPNAL